jgi:hypothetical protein
VEDPSGGRDDEDAPDEVESGEERREIVDERTIRVSK